MSKLILADVTRTDGLAVKICEQIKTDLPILLLSRQEKLNFNEEIDSLKGAKYIIVDYIENGWDWNRKETLVVGENTELFPDVCQTGWGRLHDFIKDNPPVLYFKRELLKKDVTDTLLPIEYVNFQPPFPVETKEQFDKRLISAFHYWGRSSESRLIAHGEFWKNAAKKGYSVCDNIYFFNAFMEDEKGNPNLWVSLWMPHYFRIPISELLKINSISKLSLSLPGAGVKCFRNCGESLTNSVMVMPEDNLAWSYEFKNGVNCIQFPIGKDVESIKGIKKEYPIIKSIEDALVNPNLYEIYLKGLEAAKWYHIDNYIPNYLEPLINKA